MIFAIFMIIVLVTISVANDYHVTMMLILPLYIFAEIRYSDLKNRISKLEEQLGKKENENGSN